MGYGCDDSTAVVNGVTTADTGWRPTTLEYPTTAGTATTRLLTYSYGDSGSSDDAINRLQSIGDGTATAGVPTTPDELASYAYLGVATIAKEDYTQLQIGLDYSGLDRQLPRPSTSSTAWSIRSGRATAATVPRARSTATPTVTTCKET